MSEGLTFAERGLVALGFVLAAASLALAAWHIGLWYVNRRWERDHKEVGHHE